MKYPADPLAFVKYTASMTAKMHRQAVEAARTAGYGSVSGYIQELIRADLTGAGRADQDTEALRDESNRSRARRRARK